MSLQIWLPLNGDLHNQGLSNVTVINNGATVDNNGKIGKCYSFSTNSIYGDWSGINSMTTMSGSCWVYLTGLSSAQYFFHLGGLNSHQCKLSLTYDSGYLRSHVNGAEYNSNLTLSTNTWYHLTVTFDGTKVRWYINGVEKASATVSGTFSASNHFAIGARTASTAGNTFAYYITNAGKLNDIRIYNHCLSEIEIKELAKGLILHYPLNNINIILKNLLPCGSTYTLQSPWLTTLSRVDGYTWVPNSAFEATPSTTYTISVECDGTLASGHGASASPSIKSWTFWLYICNVDTEKNWLGGAYDTPINLNSSNYNYRKINNTHVWTVTLSSTQKYISIRTNSYSNGTDNVTVKWWNMKIEKGDCFTNWNIDSNMNQVYDISGYNYHGIINNYINVVSDTPQYNTASYFIMGNGIFVHPNITLSQFTISFWGKHTVAGKMLMGSNASPTSTNTIWYWYGDNSFKYPDGEFYYTHNAGSANDLLNKWTHFIATYDGAKLKIYRNAIFEGEKDVTGDKILEYLSIGNGFSSSSYWENGYISDFRLYGTAFTPEQVIELYNMNKLI